MEGAAGTFYVSAVAHTTGAPDCRFEIRASIALSDTQGARLDVDGNGMTQIVPWGRGDAEIAIAWAWRNWCAPRPATIHIVVRSGDASAAADVSDPPSCTQPGAPSSIVPQTVAPVAASPSP
jgi:hypothetical protein